jgi:hypothetical protein
MEKMEKRYVPDTKTRYRMFELLRAHVNAIPGTDLVAYEDGWSDDRVAREIGGRMTGDHVGRARREALGELNAHPGKGAGVATRLQRLELAFNALCDKLGEQNLKV